MGKASLALIASNAIYIGTGYLVAVSLARILGPAGFGAYVVVTAILTVSTRIVARGIPIVASRSIATSPKEILTTMRLAWRTTLALAAIIAVITAIAAVPASLILGNDILVPMIVGSVAAFTFGVQAIAVAPFNGLRRFGWQASTRMLYAVMRLGSIIIGAQIAGVTGAIAGFALAPLLASIPALTRSARRTYDPSLVAADAIQPSTPSRQLEPPTTPRGIVRQALPLVITSVWVSLLLSIDLIAFRAVGSAVDAGLYGAAGTLAHVTFFLLGLLPLETLPRIAAVDDARERRALATKLLDDSLALVSFPTVLMTALGAPVFLLVFGNEFRGGGDLIGPLAIATAGVTIHSVLVSVDAAEHNVKPAVIIGMIGTICMAVTVAIGGSMFGVLGAAWSSAGTAIAVATFHWGFDYRLDRVSPPRLLTLSFLVASLPLAILIQNDTSTTVVAAVAVTASVASGISAANRLLRN